MANDLPFSASHALDGLNKALANAQDHANDHSNALDELALQVDRHDVPPPADPHLPNDSALDHSAAPDHVPLDHAQDHWPWLF